jgi:GntP family gluconate:H+ symporter
VLAALAGIALIVVYRHPFLALIFGGLTVGIVAGVNIGDVLASFADGFGTTAATVRPDRTGRDVCQSPC